MEHNYHYIIRLFIKQLGKMVPSQGSKGGLDIPLVLSFTGEYLSKHSVCIKKLFFVAETNEMVILSRYEIYESIISEYNGVTPGVGRDDVQIFPQ